MTVQHQHDSAARQQLVDAAITEGATPETAERMADEAMGDARVARASRQNADFLARLLWTR